MVRFGSRNAAESSPSELRYILAPAILVLLSVFFAPCVSHIFRLLLEAEVVVHVLRRLKAEVVYVFGLKQLRYALEGESDERNKVLKRLHSAYLLDPEFLNNREY